MYQSNHLSLFMACLLIDLLSLGSENFQFSNNNIWVNEGKIQILHCDSNLQWHKCEWTHTDSKNKVKFYHIYQNSTNLKTPNSHIEFSHLSETSCGVQILNANVGQHQVSSNPVNVK